MAAINDLINQIENPELRAQFQSAVDMMNKQKKFGLVFEEHLPECTPLYDIPVRKGSIVALKTGKVSENYVVLKLNGDTATCLPKGGGNATEFSLADLVTVAEFGEAIYPYLNPIDTVCSAPDSDLWHTLIEADNYHALQLLEYLYAGKVDCIYIDPPYNTGAKDWKYNNDYVDSNDVYRHSKWLSMMQKRLKIAKKLLNPKDSVMIVTIDEHEVHHLRVLLEELFPEFYIQMITTVINPKGVTQGRFSRVEEYVIYCFAQNAFVADSDDNLLNLPDPNRKPRWKGLLRSGTDAMRRDRESMFYPVLIDRSKQMVIRAESYLPLPATPDIKEQIDGYDVAWPIRKDGSFGRWSVGSDTLNDLIQKGYVSCGKFDNKRNTWGISYISQPNQKKIENGSIRIVGRDPITDVVEIEYASEDTRVIKTVWHRSYHDAGAYGSDLITSIIGQSQAFSFPKSLYSTKDAIAAILRNKKEALVIDFFAGSGTTLHAVNLLNKEDSGKRRCIIVTNNECSEKESIDLTRRGYHPGDEEWERHGVCQAVTWPRSKYSICGKREDGHLLLGEYFMSQSADKSEKRNYKQISVVSVSQLDTANKKKQLISLIGKDMVPQSLVTSDCKFVVPHEEKYSSSILFDVSAVDEYLSALEDHDFIRNIFIVTDKVDVFKTIKERIHELLGDFVAQERIKLPMSEGFKTNAAYFKLGFLDKTSVALGRQFKEMLPTLWMKAGAHGSCPEFNGEDIPAMLLLPKNKFAILTEESSFPEFEAVVNDCPEIETVYIVTDYETGYCVMAKNLRAPNTYQLYRDYLDNFRINTGRN